jgi:hypothetical protein
MYTPGQSRKCAATCEKERNETDETRKAMAKTK